MDARGHKRAACAVLAVDARLHASRSAQGCSGGLDGDNASRAAAAYTELAEELERRGAVVHRAPRPTRDAPALPLEHPDLLDETETT